MITLIAAVDENNLLGYDNSIPWRRPEDLKRFKALTTGGIVIMGRKTFDSIGKCLPNRLNIVLTSRPILNVEDTPVQFDDLEVSLRYARTVSDNIWVIGGAGVYKQALPLADGLDLTIVKQKTEILEPRKAVYFPSIPGSYNEVLSQVNEKDESLLHKYYVRSI